MTRGGISERIRTGRAGRRARLALALALFAMPAPSFAQLFSDRPLPIPPGLVPDVPSGGAISLAPPSGPASAPGLPPPFTQPPGPGVPPAARPPPIASTPGTSVLSRTAPSGKQPPAINGGLVWRIFSDRP